MRIVDLTGVVVGGLIAITGGLVAAWIQSIREHHRWLREKRLAAYLPAVAFLSEFELVSTSYTDLHSRVLGSISSTTSDQERQQLMAQLEDPGKRYWELRERTAAEMAALTVLGPEDVAEAARRWEKAARTTNGAPWNVGVEFAPVLRGMRKALRIRD